MLPGTRAIFPAEIELCQGQRDMASQGGLVEQFRGAAVSRSRWLATTVVEGIVQVSRHLPEIFEPVELVDVSHQLPGHLLSLGDQFGSFFRAGRSSFDFLAQSFDPCFDRVVECMKSSHVEERRGPAVNEPATVVLARKGVEPRDGSPCVKTFEYAEHFSAAVPEQGGGRQPEVTAILPVQGD